MSEVLQVVAIAAIGVLVLVGLMKVADALYPRSRRTVSGAAAFLMDPDGNVSEPLIIDGPPLPPEVQRDMALLFEVVRETGATDVFAVRHGEHFVVFVNENAARCTCGWRIIAQEDDLDDVVKAHFAEVSP